jgi:hypothetical protein
MIVLRGKCNMCGRREPAIEVEIPQATNEQRKLNGVASTSIMCAAICRECSQEITSAWARHGALDWAKWVADRKAARAYPEIVDDGRPEDT